MTHQISPRVSHTSEHRHGKRSHHHLADERRSHGEHKSTKRKRSISPNVPLPFKATKISRHDMEDYRPVFASYLDIQKQLDIEVLSETELIGRWKSFVTKWNRGELAEGWYDPATKQRAFETAQEITKENEEWNVETAKAQRGTEKRAPATRNEDNDDNDDDDDDDDIGPTLPPDLEPSGRAFGAAVPTFDDLALRQEARADEAETRSGELHAARKLDRKMQREKLEEIVPRAEPGTKERQMEKKREKASASREYRDAKGGGEEEVADGQLMGAAEGGVAEARQLRKQMDRKKNEREVRREELLRARQLEREEKLQAHKEKEDKTMEMLKALARENFG